MDGKSDQTPDEPRRGPLRRRFIAAGGAVALLLLATGAGLVFLGDDGEPEPSEEVALEAVETAAAEYAECVREQGIADYPDPEVGADGSVMFENLSALEAPPEKIQAAQDACRHILEAVMPSHGGERNEINPAAAGWEQVEADEDCQCADGSDYSFFTRKADPEKVVLYLDGGGACWSAATCSIDGDNGYQSAVESPGGDGLFDFADDRNPFADHSFVFAPYCTADLFLGNATTEYEPGLTLQHKGYVNATAALDYLAAAFPDATELVVIGASAGSAGAPLYAGLASDLLPDTPITVIADSSGAYPDTPVINEQMAASWGTGDSIPDWPENTGLTAEEWSIPGLFIQSGLHDPDIVFARHDYAYDERQAAKLEAVGVPVGDLQALIDANEALIEGAGVNLLSYVAPGTDHLALESDRFYTETVDGRPLVDWVADVAAGEQVGDVHCTDCASG